MSDFRNNGLKIDGYANPGGPSERAINNRLLGKPRGAGLLYDPPAPLAGPVGNGLKNERRDVVGVQRRLGALDFLPEDPFDRPHGFIDEPTTKAVTRFQRDNGLTPDGWLAPGGETDRALDDAISDLARAQRREWFDFAERAGRAQARRAGEDGADEADPAIVPVAIEPERYSLYPAGRRPLGPSTGAYGVPPSPRAAPAPRGRSPLPIELIPGLGAVAGALRLLEEARGKDGNKTEFIPPRTDDAPYRGSDLAKPPLDPELTRPAPYPSEPPLKLPEREEIRPEKLKPEDWVLVTPQISPWSASDLVLLNRGNDRTQGRLTGMREIVEDVARERKDVALLHIGGARDKYGAKLKEYYAKNPLKEKLGIKTIAGSALADLTFMDLRTLDLYHISLYRVSSGTKPLKEEVAQAIKFAVNTEGQTRIIVMVPNVRSDDFVDAEAFKRFLHATLDALRDAPKVTDMSDPVARDRVIRYFTQLGRK